jgi:hypothetical protein
VTGAIKGILLGTAVIAGALILTAGPLLGWWLLKGKPRAEARAEAGRLERERVREVEEDRRAALRHQRALELAQASAPVIQNLIAPAGIGLPRPVPQPAHVVRGEVER